MKYWSTFTYSLTHKWRLDMHSLSKTVKTVFCFVLVSNSGLINEILSITDVITTSGVTINGHTLPVALLGTPGPWTNIQVE